MREKELLKDLKAFNVPFLYCSCFCALQHCTVFCCSTQFGCQSQWCMFVIYHTQNVILLFSSLPSLNYVSCSSSLSSITQPPRYLLGSVWFSRIPLIFIFWSPEYKGTLTDPHGLNLSRVHFRSMSAYKLILLGYYFLQVLF